MTKLTTEEVIYLFDEQLPALLDEYPELEPRLYHAFLKAFARKEEVVALRKDVAEFRAETQANFERVDQRFEQFRAETQANFEQVDQRFEQVDQRFEQVDQRFDQVDQRFEQVDQRFDSLEAKMEAGFAELRQQIGKLGSRWGIYNESLFRQTIAALLEKSFGVQVEKRVIEGEEFDLIIRNGLHILVEITARAKSDIQRRLERKRDLYTQATGISPMRVILAVGSIYSSRAQALREAGFEVIEPEEDVEDW